MKPEKEQIELVDVLLAVVTVVALGLGLGYAA